MTTSQSLPTTTNKDIHTSIVLFFARELKFESQNVENQMKRKAQKQRTKKGNLVSLVELLLLLLTIITRRFIRRKGKKLKVIRPKVGGRRRKSRYSLAVKEETIKRFREFYADNDFQTHDTFPNSKLPLPGMYMYLTLRGSFVESKIKTKHTASKFSDVYWFFHNKNWHDNTM